MTLATAGLGYVVAIRALAWMGERTGNGVPNEIEPVLVVLLLGLVTDYTVFFMAETRRRLRHGATRMEAARWATARVAPLVFAAGTLVIAGALSLLAGKLHFFRVFGPGLAVAALVVTLVCLTLVPALMGAVGPWLFGSRVRGGAGGGPRPGRSAVEGAAVRRAAADRQARRRARRRRVRRPARRRRARGADDLAVRLVHPVPAAGERAAEDRPTRPPRGSRRASSRRPSCCSSRRASAGGSTRWPGCRRSTRASQASRRCSAPRRPAATRRSASSPRATAARRASSWSCATSRRARRPSRRSADLERRTPQLLGQAGLPRGTHASYAGESALSAETVDALVRDLRRVVVVTAILTFVLLALFLRALLAPVLLLAGSVLAFAGSFGLMALLLPRRARDARRRVLRPARRGGDARRPGQRLQRLHRGAHPRRGASPELPGRGRRRARARRPAPSRWPA